LGTPSAEEKGNFQTVRNQIQTSKKRTGQSKVRLTGKNEEDVDGKGETDEDGVEEDSTAEGVLAAENDPAHQGEDDDGEDTRD
jgi:hypothetical protein